MTGMLDLRGRVAITRRRMPAGDFILLSSDAGAVTYDADEAREAAKALRAQLASACDAETAAKGLAVAECLEREALLLDAPLGRA